MANIKEVKEDIYGNTEVMSKQAPLLTKKAILPTFYTDCRVFNRGRSPGHYAISKKDFVKIKLEKGCFQGNNNVTGKLVHPSSLYHIALTN